MSKHKTLYLILIGILMALCQFGLGRMESVTSSGNTEEIIIQDFDKPDINQTIEMDRIDPYGFSFN